MVVALVQVVIMVQRAGRGLQVVVVLVAEVVAAMEEVEQVAVVLAVVETAWEVQVLVALVAVEMDTAEAMAAVAGTAGLPMVGVAGQGVVEGMTEVSMAAVMRAAAVVMRVVGEVTAATEVAVVEAVELEGGATAAVRAEEAAMAAVVMEALGWMEHQEVWKVVVPMAMAMMAAEALVLAATVVAAMEEVEQVAVVLAVVEGMADV